MQPYRRIPTVDYLFLKFETMTPTLKKVAAEYFPNLSHRTLQEKARKQEFGFTCFRPSTSQKDPYLVDIYDLARFLDKQFREAENARNSI